MVQWKNPLNQKEMKKWSNALLDSDSGASIKLFYTEEDCVKTPKAVMILGHPMGKEAKAHFLKRRHAEILIQNNYHVVVFDFNGFGESTIGNFGFHHDILAVASFTRKIYPNLPIGYHGISLGGQSGILALAKNNDAFEFAIIEATTTTLFDFWKHYPIQHAFLKLGSYMMPKQSREYNFLLKSREIKNLESALLIYSLTDKFTPFEMAKKFQSEMTIPTKIWTAKSAKHAEVSKSIYADEYFDEIIKFLNNNIYQLEHKSKNFTSRETKEVIC